MGRTIKLKKGFDIKIVGSPKEEILSNFTSSTFSVKPTDFKGLSPIPKVVVTVGDEVKAGDTLFFDKKRPEIKYASPVSGEIVEVRRGDRRAIAEILILADGKQEYRDLGSINPSTASREDLVKFLLDNGCWPFFRQRPFNVIAEIDEIPKNIFVSGFDTSPLAPNLAFAIKESGNDLATGFEVLKKLTSGKVHYNTGPGQSAPSLSGVEVNSFSGPHPAGNVGIQIHHIDPINKGDIVWTLNVQDVVALGRAVGGRFNTERLISVGGAVKQSGYVRTYIGASIAGMLKDNLNGDNVRVISGSALSGNGVGADGHVGYFQNAVSVLDEGNQYELFGWLFPSYARPSLSRSFSGFLRPNKEYKVNTNTNGEPRAFVNTGLYQRVLPMDLYPMQLLKSILYNDFDQMEGLGIYEVVEEDLAICEFVCPSKTRMQEILAEGMETIMEQG